MLRPVLLLNAVLAKVAFPVLSQVQDDNEKLGIGYLEMIRLVSFYCIPLYFWMFAAAEPLIQLILGQGWDQTIHVFKIIVFLGIFIGIGNPIGSLILAKGRADIGFGLNVLALMVNVCAIYIGSKWGIRGMCWSLLGAMGVVLFPFNFIVCWKLAKIKPSAFFKSFLPALLISVPMTGALMLFNHHVNCSPLILQLICLFILGVGIYLLLTVLFQKAFIKQIVQMVKNG
jgi:O-antigen/teichoic acid export membrane protein